MVVFDVVLYLKLVNLVAGECNDFAETFVELWQLHADHCLTLGWIGARHVELQG